jgi:hypothetical protein
MVIGVEFAGLWFAEMQRCQWRVDFDDGHLCVNQTAGLGDFNGCLLLVASENPNLEAGGEGGCTLDSRK